MRIWNTLSTFFAVNARSVDVGTVYLIRIYLVRRPYAEAERYP